MRTDALLFEQYYFFVFRLVPSVLQAVSAWQRAFSLFPRRTKHFFDFKDEVQWKSLETNHSFSSLNSTLICPSQTVSISFIDIQYVVILLAYLPDHPETACSGPDVIYTGTVWSFVSHEYVCTICINKGT